MAEEFKGLSQEQLDKLDQFQEGTAQIYESYKALNAELKNIDTAQDKLNKTQFVGRDITTKIATLQKEAVSRTDSVRKLEAHGCDQIILADRGTFLGYGQLVNDMTCFPIMQKTGYPVCYDATHSIQLPTSMGNISGGQREFIPYLVRAAAGCGVNALFMETHDNPKEALSDGNTVLDLQYLENVLHQAKIVHEMRLELLEKFGEDDVHPE